MNRTELTAIRNQMSADLDAAIAKGNTRTYWQCGGDRIKHRTRTTAEECRNTTDRITQITYAPKVPGISRSNTYGNTARIIERSRRRVADILS